ncbi:FGGY-family carbohydrate kinase [Pedobacter nutrimenti]|uniref:Sugar (Pentulose or hexulose) kinase n=1 Tax=Pedobacter nutrimenti TaxID=1241337 RepID=A0A318UA01_9SPHI|nr:FGGY family carbohydrate kinase [Pedobacter nutrimenti]PYF72411.1 sugar (pentulose or hexulose) kinase [Pedobacter nutrimenti]
MNPIPVIAVFDVGKTNKKLFLFDENYKIVFERSARFMETVDEDGAACENLESLRLSIFDSLREVFRKKEFEVKAINFSTYGASFVYIDQNGTALAPLYNYLKAYPEALKQQFYDNYGGPLKFSSQTASPVLGSLNSGLQLYRIKYEKPELFEKVKYALHLPQYLSHLISGVACSDITSIGCHTGLWDFEKNEYHSWLKEENILGKLAPIKASDETFPACFPGNNYLVGTGLHDSSAALIPYLANFTEPFVLLSTGTWCITMNPFNHSPLTEEELQKDCLCYLHYKGKPVKASRLFAGYEHEQQEKRIIEHFNQDKSRYKDLELDMEIVSRLQERNKNTTTTVRRQKELSSSGFEFRDLNTFSSGAEAYHQLLIDMVNLQLESTNLVLKDTPVKRIFVDGGFSKNAIYMHLLAAVFPEIEVFAASMAQATAVGTALAIHQAWNRKALPTDLIELKYYSHARLV